MRSQFSLAAALFVSGLFLSMNGCGGPEETMDPSAGLSSHMLSANGGNAGSGGLGGTAGNPSDSLSEELNRKEVLATSGYSS